jgi:hypothetical protein
MTLKRLFYTIAHILFMVLNVNAQVGKGGFLCAFMDGGAQDLCYCVSGDGYHLT